MSVLFLFVLLMFLIWGGRSHLQSYTAGGPTVFRSEPIHLRKDHAMCGNCHGTGRSDFGLGASWGDTCDCCDGRGQVYMDPNVKTMTLSEFLMEHEKVGK